MCCIYMFDSLRDSLAIALIKNGYSLNSSLYEEINKGTKKNVTLNIYDLQDNNIEEKDLSSLSFKLDIYNPDVFLTDGYVEDNLKVKYKF